MMSHHALVSTKDDMANLSNKSGVLFLKLVISKRLKNSASKIPFFYESGYLLLSATCPFYNINKKEENIFTYNGKLEFAPQYDLNILGSQKGDSIKRFNKLKFLIRVTVRSGYCLNYSLLRDVLHNKF